MQRDRREESSIIPWPFRGIVVADQSPPPPDVVVPPDKLENNLPAAEEEEAAIPVCPLPEDGRALDDDA